jgi:type II secretory pathway pseudopilin PulG
MRRQPSSRGAFTLVELVASMAGASILVAGMASTMFVALRASNPTNTPAAGMLTALSCMSDMSAELQYARVITESTANAITATVPDRTDADATPETVRYAWSGVAGQPLTRRYNGGTVVNVIPSVQSFTVEYFPSAAAAEYVTVRIQATTSTRSVVETSISLLNL